MIRVNRKHMAVLFLQPFLYIAAHAEDRALTEKEDNSIKSSIVNAIAEHEVQDETGNSPLKFGAGVSTMLFYDTKPYGAHSSFSPKLLNANEENPNQINAYFGAYFLFEKTFKVMNHVFDLHLQLEKEEGKDNIVLNNYYVENKFIRFGHAPGNFNSYISSSDRYTAKQIAFTHDLGCGWKYTVAIEEAKEITVHPGEFEEKALDKYETAKIKDTLGNEIEVYTTKKDVTKESKLNTVKRYPMLALAANTIYSKDWGNVQASGLAAVTEYYHGVINEKNPKYEQKIVFGLTLSTKYVINHKEEFPDKEADVIKAHVKYLHGLGGYQREVGGLPKSINPNFFLDEKKTKIEDVVKSIGGSIDYKHVWSENFSSSLAVTALLVLNAEKINDKERYANALVAKLNPFSYNFKTNFSVSPSYSIGFGNLITSGDIKTTNIQRFAISLSYDL